MVVRFRSLTTRLIFWTLLAGGVVFTATFVMLNRLARATAIEAAALEAGQTADRLANRVRAVLVAVEESTQLLGAVLETMRPDAGSLERLLRRFVASEDDVSGAAAAFVPGRFPGRPLFAPFVAGTGQDPAQLRFVELGEGDGYTHLGWYREPARTLAPAWSEPYLDATGAAMVTYSLPFFEDEGGGTKKLLGVVSADVRLDFLARIVSEVHPGQTGRALILSHSGRVLALSETESLELEAALPPEPVSEARADLEPLVRHMLSREPGFTPLELKGERGRAIYEPIGIAGWSLGVFYPEKELMAGAERLRLLQATLGLLGLLLLAVVVVLLSRRLTAPLRELAGAARELATNLDAPLPAARSGDELGALAAAFAEMRDELRRYVNDLEATTAAKQRLESELGIARRIQMDMLPPAAAGSPGEGYELAALVAPARAVGGDLFDHLAAEGHLFFLVADVSGKGVPAALFMARAKTLFETASARGREPGEILADVNRGLCRENDAGMYVTAVCGVLQLATGELSLARAAHQPPILLRRGEPPAPLAVEGATMLGLFEDVEFPTTRHRLAPGDTLVGYTDGVDEALDVEEQPFGGERLLRCLAGLAGSPVWRIPEHVRDAVRAFTAAAAQSDDITVLALHYIGRPRD